jgi:hypothetical protein
MKISRRILLVAGVLLSSGLSWGEHRLVANVPFGFTSPAGHLPPGHYRIVAGVGGNADITELRHEESRKSVVLLNGGLMYNRDTFTPRPARLVFQCGDSGCSLAEIWPGHGGDGWWFIQPRKRFEVKSRIAMVTVPAARRP